MFKLLQYIQHTVQILEMGHGQKSLWQNRLKPQEM